MRVFILQHGDLDKHLTSCRVTSEHVKLIRLVSSLDKRPALTDDDARECIILLIGVPIPITEDSDMSRSPEARKCCIRSFGDFRRILAKKSRMHSFGFSRRPESYCTCETHKSEEWIAFNRHVLRAGFRRIRIYLNNTHSADATGLKMSQAETITDAIANKGLFGVDAFLCSSLRPPISLLLERWTCSEGMS